MNGRLIQVLLDYRAAWRKISHNARMYLWTAVFMALTLGIYLVLFNLYILELGYNEQVVGQLAAFIALGVAVGGLPAGVLYDRFNAKQLFTVAILGIVLTMCLMALSSQRQLLSLWAIAHGFFESIFFVCIFPFITDQSTPEERPYLYGLNLVVWSGFRVIAALVAGHLPGLWQVALNNGDALIQLRFSLVTGSLLGILALLPLTFIRSHELAHTKRIRTSLLPSAKSRSAILKGAMILAMTGLVTGLTQPFYNVYFKRAFAADTELIGTLFSLSELTALVSALVLPGLVNRWGLVNGPAFITILSSPFVLVMGAPLGFPVVAVTFLIVVGLQWLSSTPLMNLVMEIVNPGDRGAMSGVRLITNYSAQALAGLIGGWVVIRAGYAQLFALAAIIQLVFGGTLWLLFRHRPEILETTIKA